MRAINDAVGRLYGGKVAGSWTTAISWALGGPDPLDRVRAYRADDHWHYVGYGCSDLDEKSFPDSELSGFGFELTFRLRGAEPEPPVWPVHFLQSLVRYVWDTNNYFRAGDWMPFNNAWRAELGLAGAVFVEDPQVPTITTEYGKVQFLQVVGVPAATIERIAKTPAVWDAEVVALRERDPLLVTTRDAP